MSPAQEVCVDASLAVQVMVTEPDSDKADALFDEWANEGRQLIAPAFFEVETDSILQQKVTPRKELTPEQAEAAFVKWLQNYIPKTTSPSSPMRRCGLAR